MRQALQLADLALLELTGLNMSRRMPQLQRILGSHARWEFPPFFNDCGWSPCAAPTTSMPAVRAMQWDCERVFSFHEFVEPIYRSKLDCACLQNIGTQLHQSLCHATLEIEQDYSRGDHRTVIDVSNGIKSLWNQRFEWDMSTGGYAEANNMGLYSISGKTSYHQDSWNLESLWNSTGSSAALLPMCLSNFKAIGKA